MADQPKIEERRGSEVEHTKSSLLEIGGGLLVLFPSAHSTVTGRSKVISAVPMALVSKEEASH